MPVHLNRGDEIRAHLGSLHSDKDVKTKYQVVLVRANLTSKTVCLCSYYRRVFCGLCRSPYTQEYNYTIELAQAIKKNAAEYCCGWQTVPLPHVLISGLPSAAVAFATLLVAMVAKVLIFLAQSTKSIYWISVDF